MTRTRSPEDAALIQKVKRQWAILGIIAMLVGVGIVADNWDRIMGPDERSVSMGTASGQSFGETYGAMSREAMPAQHNYCLVPAGVAEDEYPDLNHKDFCDAFDQTAATASAQAAADPSTALGAQSTPLPTSTPTQDVTDTVEEPVPTAANPCVANCTWTRADVARDLESIVCTVDYDMTLSEDVTELYPVEADQALLCTAGGSMDTSGYGIVYLWDDFEEITDQVLEPFQRCDSLGAAVYGGDAGNPGYLVANIQTGQPTVDALVEGGASVLCPVRG